jgi:hypothetical protein
VLPRRLKIFNDRSDWTVPVLKRVGAALGLRLSQPPIINGCMLQCESTQSIGVDVCPGRCFGF